MVVPPSVVTSTSAGPAVPGGVVHVTDEASPSVTLQVEPPTVTVAPVKLVPVIVSTVPPVVGPTTGDTELTVGAAT
jgi:hypothetical protein